MPTAFNRGHQALPPSAPTLPIPQPAISDTSVRKPLAGSHPAQPKAEQLPHFYGLDYFHSRLKALGLTRNNALDYGLDVDAQGNILQLVRRFDGSFIEFIPQQFRKKVDRILNHRSVYQPHLEMYNRLLAVTRFHPDYLKDHPKRSKYGNQFGEKVRPLPAPLAIKAYNQNTSGGLITFIEGYFKAIALDRAGIESVAFTGITVYCICPALREYLLRRRPDRIFIMYDNDALDISSSSPARAQRAGKSPSLQAKRLSSTSGEAASTMAEGHLSSRRNEAFANSARKFAIALFSLFSSIDHTCEIVFVMGKPDLGADDHPEQRRKERFDTGDAGARFRSKRSAKESISKSKVPTSGSNVTSIPRGSTTRPQDYQTTPKGLDDLIETHGATPVTKDLLEFNFTPTFRKSKFFAGFTLAKSTCNRKLNRLFLGDNYRHWIERLSNHPRAKKSAASAREGLVPSQRAQRADNSGSSKRERSDRLKGRSPSTESTVFTYRGATYQPISTGNLYDDTITYQLNTDPFAVDVPTDHLVIKQYLTDQSKALRNLINNKHRLAIQAPTGSGKTTFLIKFAKREKIRMVIAMPTVNLAQQTARGTGGFVLTGERDTSKIRAANDKHLVICTYDTLHQVPDLWRRALVIDEAHNLINQYGQVYNGYAPFRAETLRNCVRCFPEAKKTILLSGTMPPLLCHAFNFHLVTFRRLENPTVRIFDIEANGSDNAALSKCLITRLAEIFPKRAQQAHNSGSHERSKLPRLPSPAGGGLGRGRGRGPRAPRAHNSGSLKAKRLTSKSGSAASKQPAEGRLGRGRGRGPRAQRAHNSGSLKAKRLTSKSGSAASKQFATGKLHVVFWNNTNQINRLKDTLVELNYLREDEIAIISRTHAREGLAPSLDDIIRNQKINPRIKLLLCTCLISEGVNIKNTNVGRIYTVGLRCEDTFRQFIARFRKLKTVNVFSILEAERDLHPEFFQPAKIELLENLERAKLQAEHLRRRQEAYHCDYDEAEFPFLDQIQKTKDYNYRNQLLELVYRQGTPCLHNNQEPNSWLPDPLHVLAAIHGRKLATSNNCYFYTRLRANNFSVFRVKHIPPDKLIEETINTQYETAKATRKDFREKLLKDLTSHPGPLINALYLLYQEKDNRHGLHSLRTLVPDLLDDSDGATGAQYLGQHRKYLDDYAKRRILRFAKLHALGVQNKAPFLSLSITDFNHEYQAALFHFEQLVADDPNLRKRMLPAHKEEVRIKQKIVASLTTSLHPVREGLAPSQPLSPLSGKALLQKLAPLLSVPRPRNLPPPVVPKYRVSKTPNSSFGALGAFDILGLTPAKAINLLRRIMHTTITGHGRYRTVTILAPFSKAGPPPLAAVATKLTQNPIAVLPLLSS